MNLLHPSVKQDIFLVYNHFMKIIESDQINIEYNSLGSSRHNYCLFLTMFSVLGRPKLNSYLLEFHIHRSTFSKISIFIATFKIKKSDRLQIEKIAKLLVFCMFFWTMFPNDNKIGFSPEEHIKRKMIHSSSGLDGTYRHLEATPSFSTALFLFTSPWCPSLSLL